MDSRTELKDAVSLLFQDNTVGQPPSRLNLQKLPADLTVASLIEHHSYSVEWTHDLTNHLHVDRDHKILTVFERKILAHNHVRFGTASLPVPDQLFEEVIDTLNLLFPFQDDATKRILAKDNIAFHGLGLWS